MNKSDILFSLAIFFLIISSIAVGYKGESHIENMINKFKYNSSDTPEQCRGLNLVTTAYCLNLRVNEVYNFTITDDKIDLTFEELKQKGGDCRDWSKLYCNWAKELGFDITRPVVMNSNETAHTFCIMSNDEGYCILDQINFKCFYIEG